MNENNETQELGLHGTNEIIKMRTNCWPVIWVKLNPISNVCIALNPEKKNHYKILVLFFIGCA